MARGSRLETRGSKSNLVPIPESRDRVPSSSTESRRGPSGYHGYHTTRAELLRRLGCSQKSRAAYDKAIDLAGNIAETAYLTRRRDQ
jgi:hypothetical protein